RAPSAAGDRSTVINDVLEGDGQGGLVALYDHAEGIADQQHINLTFVEKLREGGVVGSEHGDLLTALFHHLQGVDGDLLGLHSALFSLSVLVGWLSRLVPVQKGSRHTFATCVGYT